GTQRLKRTLWAGSAGPLPCSDASTPCGRYRDSRSFSALIEERVGDTWRPFGGESVLFTLGRQRVQASTGPDGRATVTIPLEQGEGTYALAASFSAEDSQTHLGSGSAAATFTIEKAPTTLTLTAPATGTYGMQWSPTA